MVRADEESIDDLSKIMEEKLLKKISDSLKTADAVIFEDYNKGVLTQKLTQEAIGICKKKKLINTVDPKQKNFHFFDGATLIKPNKKEAGQMVLPAVEKTEDVFKAAKQILNEYHLEAVLITLGESGMALYEKTGEFTSLPSVARKVYDVTGAGDTVISTLTTFLAAGADFKEAAYLANQAAGIVVGEIGAATVTLDQILRTSM
jgi:D-beta-D-heptose 7-phosphate kinase/D-beta-D-heptose 1-phosphate adenosyltransferase